MFSIVKYTIILFMILAFGLSIYGLFLISFKPKNITKIIFIKDLLKYLLFILFILFYGIIIYQASLKS